METFADNSVLSALSEIQLIWILPELFGKIIIPQAVADEALHPAAPSMLRELVRLPPAWLIIVPNQPTFQPLAKALDRGELHVISLALQAEAGALVLLDDMIARNSAEEYSLHVTGTLGILKAASRREMIDLDSAIEKLLETGFRASRKLLEDIRTPKS